MGSGDGCAGLGLIRDHSGDRKGAREYFRKGCSYDSALSCDFLSTSGVSMGESRKARKKACTLGHKAACR